MARSGAFEVDADSLLDEMTDDLLYHGDVNSALRKMMQDGLRDANGERIAGMRELMQKLREQRQEIQERGDLGGVYSEIADALNDIVDEERHAIQNYTEQAANSGDERRAETAKAVGDGQKFPAGYVARRPGGQGFGAAALRLSVEGCTAAF